MSWLLEASTPTIAKRELISAAPILSRESRWMRLAGIGLVVVAMSGFAMFIEAGDRQQLVGAGGRSHFTWLALVFPVSANLFVLGLILLLAGLRQLSLRTSVHARRGALARMAAVNLALLCYAVVVLEDSGIVAVEIDPNWYRVPLVVAFLLLARVSIRLFRSGWRHETPTAEEALASDPRRPVLYLRSFGVDDRLVVTSSGLGARLASLLAYTVSVSPEQELAFILERIGPVIAIGKPGERLPELGAARRYVGDGEWRTVVGELMNDAALVVIRAGETASLWWETDAALTRCSPERVIIVALGQADTFATFERRFTETFGKPAAPPAVPRSWVLATFLRLLWRYGGSLGKIIYFDQQARPYEEPLWFRVTWSGYILLPYRPYRDPLRAAFRTVFAKLGLRWPAKRDLTTAVLLALFGGMLGLHLFYTGNTRRGMWYLAFFWLGVPIVLGLIDAVRLALLDEAQFQARLKIASVSQEGRT